MIAAPSTSRIMNKCGMKVQSRREHMINPPRERGRPALPLAAQKVKINITIDRDILERLSSNRSKHINAILRKALMSES